MIRPLDEPDVASVAGWLADLPLLQRYRRTAADLARDLRAAQTRGDQLLVNDPGDGGPGRADALVWFMPAGTLAMGGYLRLLAVSPGADGRGLGSSLLAEFERAVAERSRHAFLLVSDFNDRAQRFYARHGYTQVGRLPALVVPDVDELLYWRRLAGR
ncbi:MAG TPA: GNAT family N-acetyltransferase [Candidatus Acidoferrum sp.]|nr:GNAT family N-acetyltransferase [Candidatus Acidoferrum sp.]